MDHNRGADFAIPVTEAERRFQVDYKRKNFFTVCLPFSMGCAAGVRYLAAKGRINPANQGPKMFLAGVVGYVIGKTYGLLKLPGAVVREVPDGAYARFKALSITEQQSFFQKTLGEKKRILGIQDEDVPYERPRRGADNVDDEPPNTYLPQGAPEEEERQEDTGFSYAKARREWSAQSQPRDDSGFSYERARNELGASQSPRSGYPSYGSERPERRPGLAHDPEQLERKKKTTKYGDEME